MSSPDLTGGTVADLSEADLIAILLHACPTLPAPTGPGDDAALLPVTRHPRVITTDALIEGTHFLRAHPPRSLGWKALAVNLSDIAAMGAVPESFLLSLALPPDLPLAWFHAFAQGLGAYARMHEVHLVGGDTVRTSGAHGPMVINITAWGELPSTPHHPDHSDHPSPPPLTRSGGHPGDLLMVAGPIGRAGHGLDLWLHPAVPHPTTWAAPDDIPQDINLLEQHLQPTPPLWAGPWAAAHGATAGMDLSDGLATDLPRLAAASDLQLEVDLDHLPADDLLGDLDPRVRAAHGEDYSLAVLVPPANAEAFTSQGFVAIGRAIGRALAAPSTTPATPGETPPPAAPRVIWRLAGQVVPPVTPTFAHFR